MIISSLYQIYYQIFSRVSFLFLPYHKTTVELSNESFCCRRSLLVNWFYQVVTFSAIFNFYFIHDFRKVIFKFYHFFLSFKLFFQIVYLHMKFLYFWSWWWSFKTFWLTWLMMWAGYSTCFIFVRRFSFWFIVFMLWRRISWFAFWWWFFWFLFWMNDEWSWLLFRNFAVILNDEDSILESRLVFCLINCAHFSLYAWKIWNFIF